MPEDRERTEAIGSGEVSSRLPFAILAAGLVISGGLLLNLTSQIGFLADEWNLLILRPGWGVNQLFDHFNGHPIMAPALIYKLLLEIFGMESARPMQVAAIGTFLLMNVLLFIYLRRRAGDWAALIGTFLILFLGAAFEDLLFSFQIGYFGSLAAGIGALIALDRDDREGDIAASVLLVVSIMFSSLGLAFIAAAFIEWILNPRDRRGRWFVPGASMIFYVIWWIGWGGQENAESMSPEFSISVLPKVPGYVFDAFSSGLVSLAGLATGSGFEPDQPNLVLGQLAAVLLIGLAIWRVRNLSAFPRNLLVVTGGLASLLLLFALGQDSFLAYGTGEVRPPTASRYQLPIAVFTILVAGTLLHGVKMRAVWLVMSGFLALVAISGGLQQMSEQATERWQPASSYMRAKLSGVEAGASSADAGTTFRLGTTFDVPVLAYIGAVEDFGSPALPRSAEGLSNPPLDTGFDQGLIEASGVAVSGSPPPYSRSTCRQLGAGQNLDLEPGRFVVVNEGEGELSVNLARISDPPGVLVGAILPNARAGLDLPKGTIDDPWTISFAGEGPVEVCDAR